MLFFIGGDFIRIELTIIIILILFILIYFFVIEPYLNKIKINNKNEYGSARFSTFNEIKQNFKEESTDNIKDTGVPIWYSKDCKTIWFDRETPHYVYLGSTGCGKSVTCVIPTCSFIANSKNKRSVFITDPKGEIYNTTSQMFKDNGYEIYTIDFRKPELSNKINLLEPIIKEYELYIKNEDEYKKFESDIKVLESSIELDKDKMSKTMLDGKKYMKEKLEDKLIDKKNTAMKHLAEANRLITSLSTMIMSDKAQEKDPFWNNSARNLLEGLISLFLEEYRNGKVKREQITLTSINKFESSFMDEANFEILKNYIDRKPYGMKSKDSLTSLLSTAENTFKSITSTYSEKMSLFDDVNVANLTSSSDFEFDILGKKPTAIYIIVPDEDKTYYKLITIIVGLLYRELVKLANSKEEKKVPVQIDWLLDEFANCPPLADIEALVSVARSRGMRFHFFIQSLSQLDNVYGKDVAQIILDNCGMIYLKTNTQATAEAISKRLGKKTIESNSFSQNVGKLLDYNKNKSVGLMGRDLMTPEEVKQLHHKTIIFPIIGYPIFRSTIMYNKFSCYQSGECERKAKILEDLSYTYFTVEKLTPNLKRQKIINNDEITPEEEFYNEFKEQFTSINKEIEKKLSNIKYVFEWITENGTMYSCFKINQFLEKKLFDSINDLKINGFELVIENGINNANIKVYQKL